MSSQQPGVVKCVAGDPSALRPGGGGQGRGSPYGSNTGSCSSGRTAMTCTSKHLKTLALRKASMSTFIGLGAGVSGKDKSTDMQMKQHKHENKQTAASSGPSSLVPGAPARRGQGGQRLCPWLTREKAATGTQLALLPGAPSTGYSLLSSPPSTGYSLLSPRLLVDVGKDMNFMESQSELAQQRNNPGRQRFFRKCIHSFIQLIFTECPLRIWQ